MLCVLPLRRRLRFPHRMSFCPVFVCLSNFTEKLLIRYSWKFCRRCICRQGRTYYLLNMEVVHICVRIQEFCEGFFNVSRYSSFAHISGKLIRSWCKVYRRFLCIWTKKVSLNFGSHTDPDFRSTLRIQTGFALAEVSAHQLLLLCMLLICYVLGNPAYMAAVF